MDVDLLHEHGHSYTMISAQPTVKYLIFMAYLVPGWKETQLGSCYPILYPISFAFPEVLWVERERWGGIWDFHV
jgi:hypothetical protein